MLLFLMRRYSRQHAEQRLCFCYLVGIIAVELACRFCVCSHASFSEGVPCRCDISRSEILGSGRPSDTGRRCFRFPGDTWNMGQSRSFCCVGFFGSATTLLPTPRAFVLTPSDFVSSFSGYVFLAKGVDHWRDASARSPAASPSALSADDAS